MELSINATSLPVSLAFVSINVLIFLALSILVVRGRWQEKVGIGAGGKPRLELKIRAHGNFAEYVPLALLLLALLEAAGSSRTLLIVLGAVLTLARLSHAVGLRKGAGPNIFRFLGTLGTWVMMMVAALLGLHAVLL